MIRTVCSTLHRHTHTQATPRHAWHHTHTTQLKIRCPSHRTARPTMKQGKHPPLRRRGRVTLVDLTPSLTADPRWFHLRLFCIRNRSEAPGISPETPASLHLCISQPSIVNPHTHHLNHPRLPASGSTPRRQPTTRSTCIRQSYPDLPGLHSIRGSLLVYGLFLGPKLSVKG
jgi:hypothetical protein